jgi:hypothetical protein
VVRVGDGFAVTTPKSDAGTRDVAIPPHLVPFIAEHLAKHVVSPNAWTTVQYGLTELLVSPAAKRRAAELQPPGPDTDAVAAVSMLGKYRSKPKPV